MSLKRLKVASLILPVLFMVALDLVRHKLWFDLLHTWTGLIVTALVVTVLSVAFTLELFKQIEDLDAANARLRQESQEALAFFEGLIHHCADGVIVVDIATGLIRIWNEGAEAIYGFNREEAIGSPYIMVPPERQYELPGLIERVRRGDVVRNFETVRMNKDGRRIDVMVTVTPIRNAQGELVAMLGISKDITTEKRAERQAQQLAIMEEQERIGMDLHDGIIQAIYGVALQLEDCADQVEVAPEAVRVRLDRAIESLHEVTRDIRSYILRLRPEASKSGDLATGLRDLLHNFEANSLIAGDLTVKTDAAALDSQQVAHLLQLTREALANVQRHARATAVSVTLDEDGDSIRLTVRDNGRGWDQAAEQAPHQMGLRNMKERARAAGGELRIETAPGAGTGVVVTVPQRQVAQCATERVIP